MLETGTSAPIAKGGNAGGPVAAPLALLWVLACLATIGGWIPGRTLAPADDATDRVMVGKTVAAEQLWRGRMPLWNNRAGLGGPLLGDGETGVLFPTTLLHVLPPAWSWTLDGVLRLWIGGAGAWLLARRMGLICPARFLAAAAYMLCGFAAAYLIHPLGPLLTLAPWLLLLVDRLVERVSVLRILLLTLLLTVSFFTGQVSGAAQLVMSAIVFWIARAAIPPSGVSHLRALAAGPAIFIASITAYVAAGVEQSTHEALLAGQQIVVGLPGSYRFPAGWIGIVPAMLGLTGLAMSWRDPRVILWAVVAIVALLRFQLLSGLMEGLVPVTPSIGAMATFSLALAMLAGLGLERLIQHDLGRPGPAVARLLRRLPIQHVTAGLIGLTALELLIIFVTLNSGSSLARLRAADDALEAIRQAQQQPTQPTQPTQPAQPNLAGRVTATDLPPAATAMQGMIDIRMTGAAVPTNVRQTLPQVLGKPLPQLDLGQAPSRLIGLRYHIGGEVAGGGLKAIAPGTHEDPQALPRAWVARAGSYVPDAAAVAASIAQARFDPRQMVPLLNVEAPVPADEDEDVVRPRLVSRYASSATGAPSIEWVSDEGDKVKFRIGGGSGGYLVLADAWAPGWQATVQQLGAPVTRSFEMEFEAGAVPPRPVDATVAAALGFLRAVPLPYAGRAQSLEVIMDYKPEGWKRGLAASLLGMIVMLLLAGMSMMEAAVREKPAPPQERVPGVPIVS